MKPKIMLLMFCGVLAVQAQDPAPDVSTPAPAPPADAVIVPSNLLRNASFEYGMIDLGRAPDDWGFITKSGGKMNAGITEAAAHSGKRSVGLGPPLFPTDKWQVVCFNSPVEGKAAYQFTAWIKAYPADPLFGGTEGFITIEWKNADGKEITRIQGDTWGETQLASGEWIQVKVAGEAPSAATTATFAVTYSLSPKHKSGGSFLIDDVLAEKVSK